MSQARRGVNVKTAEGENARANGVREYLHENFGTPMELVAWLRLPVDYGGHAGVVAAHDSAGPLQQMKVSFTSAVDGFERPAEIVWMSGEQAGKIIAISGYDAKSGEIGFSGPLEAAPAEGTEFIIHPGQGLTDGRRLYMTHCVHCHGTSGDGDGPTAKYLNPKPRDYRRGVFKFTSTKEPNKVTRDDLKRIVRHGIPGTYMPSFMLLEDDELHAIVEYVRWLAMRGEFERKLNAELSGDYSIEALRQRKKGGELEGEIKDELKQFLASDFPEAADSAANDLADAWNGAEQDDAIIVPAVARVDDTLQSRAIGRHWFLSKEVNCQNCHGPHGLGNGPQTEDYEEDPLTKQKLSEPGLHDDWGHIVKPRNLTRGIYRGGRRPIDIFRRVYAGIKGAKMPAFGRKIKPPAETQVDNLAQWQDEQIWHIVNYVLSLPFEGRSSAGGGSAEVVDLN